MDFNQAVLKAHEEHRGKIAMTSSIPLENAEDLSLVYTPGVALPCLEIEKDPAKVYRYTSKGHTVAVISDGSAVLGLGNIGALASIPVMEGKAVLFKKFGDVDAVPICLNTQDTEEIIRIVKAISPCFGGINLEDIASPRCFEIEQRLDAELDIPVFHDDQHGTAIVVASALINAVRMTGRALNKIKIVLNGPGSAGTAIINMLLSIGVRDIIACDEHGILYAKRPEGMPPHKIELCKVTNPLNLRGSLDDALCGADVFIGVSVGGVLTAQMIRRMAANPIVFAMANPTPEIMYDEAMQAGVRVMGTGRSDFPNQINNVLVFPGLFRGALEVYASTINADMKIAAAYAIADLIEPDKLDADYIIPSLFDPRVKDAVAKAVADAAVRTDAARFADRRHV